MNIFNELKFPSIHGVFQKCSYWWLLVSVVLFGWSLVVLQPSHFRRSTTETKSQSQLAKRFNSNDEGWQLDVSELSSDVDYFNVTKCAIPSRREMVSDVKWSNVVRQASRLDKQFEQFEFPICGFLQLMEDFHMLAVQKHIRYFMYGGTLLGSMRHHGKIPWDDDIDLAVNVHDRKSLLAALKDHPTIAIYEYTKTVWKIWNREHSIAIKTPSGGHFKWGYPFIDFFFYEVSNSRVYTYPYSHLDLNTSVENVFPLRLRPFENLLMWSPAKPHRVLRNLFGTSKSDPMFSCKSNSWSHIMERQMKNPSSQPCKLLRQKFPFVQRHSAARYVVERLRFRQKTLRTFADTREL